MQNYIVLLLLVIIAFSQANEVWTDSDCSQRCTCVNGQAQCETLECGANEECDQKNGITDCYCIDGFTRLGDSCARGEYQACSCIMNVYYYKLVVILYVWIKNQYTELELDRPFKAGIGGGGGGVKTPPFGAGIFIIFK